MKHPSSPLGNLIKSEFDGGGFNIKIDNHLLLGPMLSGFGSVVLVVDRSAFDVFDILSKDQINTYRLIEKEASSLYVKGFLSPALSAYQSGIHDLGSGSLEGVLIVSNDFYFNGLLNSVFPPDSFLIRGDVLYSDLVNFLKNSNYMRTEVVVSSGEYAIRGGVVDFYPPHQKFPFRCSFLEDSCQINSFDINSQISFGKNINSVELFLSRGAQDKKVSVRVLLNKLSTVFYSSFDKILLGGKGSLLKTINTCNNSSYGENNNIDPCLRSFGYCLGGINYFPKKLFTSPSYLEKQHVSSNHFRPQDINVGDYVVHEDFGVGIMLGLVEERGEDVGCAVQLNDGVVSVGLSHMNKLSFFADGGRKHSLGSLSKKGLWIRKKKRALEESKVFVDGLVNQYAKRQLMSRSPYKIDSGLEKEFLNSFGYVDTLDQARAWVDIKGDLVGVLPMNRLLCGDVGFGKTELAMRASFVVALSGRNVVVLCPTTVLCKQIYDSFVNRLGKFGITVGMVSRLNSKEHSNNINGFCSGKINVLVGTHAVIKKIDVLGTVDFLVIDEEQRFGVEQKELFLNKNPNIDVLLMSATPIPRSLQLSLNGLRDLSLLQTPPKNRMPIKTEIVRFSKKTIRSAILFEISRGGQVFFLNNNIKEMSYYASLIKDLKISYEVVHGKMSSAQIKNRMSRFVGGEVDILFSTTIIENGIDVPRANTILINDAHLFGVSQLHQIRGRVGRSFYQGFAYLMVPKTLSVVGEIKDRLLALEKNIVLGSGYALSNKDLEIRGGGTPFGYKQSGLAWSLGFELYGKIIQNAIVNKGDISSWKINFPSVDLNWGEKIPQSYLPSESLRLSFYSLLTKTDSLDALHSVVGEMENRFGVFPEDLSLLIESKKLSLRCSGVGVLGVSREESVVSIFFNDLFEKKTWDGGLFLASVEKVFKKIKYNFKHLSNNRLVVSFKYDGNKLSLIELLNKFINSLERL